MYLIHHRNKDINFYTKLLISKEQIFIIIISKMFLHIIFELSKNILKKKKNHNILQSLTQIKTEPQGFFIKTFIMFYQKILFLNQHKLLLSLTKIQTEPQGCFQYVVYLINLKHIELVEFCIKCKNTSKHFMSIIFWPIFGKIVVFSNVSYRNILNVKCEILFRKGFLFCFENKI